MLADIPIVDSCQLCTPFRHRNKDEFRTCSDVSILSKEHSTFFQKFRYWVSEVSRRYRGRVTAGLVDDNRRNRHLKICFYVFVGYLVTSVEDFIDNSEDCLGIPINQLKMCVTTEH